MEKEKKKEIATHSVKVTPDTLKLIRRVQWLMQDEIGFQKHIPLNQVVRSLVEEKLNSTNV
jgi:hypothetical protein